MTDAGEGNEREPRPGAEGSRITQAGEVRSARIESMRAVAALAVFCGHAFGSAHDYRPEIYATYWDRLLLGGGFGVFLFFTLSGYLLFWPFARRDFGGGDSISLRRYALNRAVRILPLYYVVVVVVLLVQEGGGSFEQWWRFLLFAENFSVDTVGKVDGVLWSLVVELHFYALLPLLALFLGRIARGSVGRAILVLVALALASYALRRWSAGLSPDVEPLWRYSLPTTFWFFVTGMLLALLRVAWQDGPPRWLRGPLASATAWLLASLPLWALVIRDYRLEPVAVASFLMVGACVLPLRQGRLVRLLDWRPLAVIGVASYSLYLWHVPILDRLTSESLLPTASFPELLAVAAPLCIGVALLSYAVVESPFLRLRRRWARSAPAQLGRAPAALG